MIINNDMKLGIWVRGTDVQNLHGIGFDYIEMEFRTIATISEREFERLALAVNDSGCTVEYMNCFLPHEVNIFSYDFFPRTKQYLLDGFRRASLLGAKGIVFGSPKARQKPTNLATSRIESRLIKVLNELCDLAQERQMRIILEPICTIESNFINTIIEADIVAQKLDGKIGVLCDLYHMNHNGEAFQEILKARYLCHSHIVNPKNRYCPLNNDEGVYEAFLQYVCRTKAVKSITVEVPINNCRNDINESLSFLRKTITRICKEQGGQP